jgi:NAD(P)H-hydrate repair Nnr-like enzyme with NAD(P)H-hydrate epimerase domain
MNSLRVVPVVSVVSVAAAFGFAGCGETTIDNGKLQDKIKTGVTEQTGAKVKSVNCPSGVKAEKGKTFTCDITAANGQTGKITVTQSDSKGNVTWKITTVN